MAASSMIPLGYMAKAVAEKADWLEASQVQDIYSVSGCIAANFCNYIPFWKHNGYWFFDSPEIIRSVAEQASVDLTSMHIFFYEAYDRQFDGETWEPYVPEASFATNVEVPRTKRLEGFDIVTFSVGTCAECSPLSCNYFAKAIATNAHCLLVSFEVAYSLLESGAFENSEPGPYRIFAVYSVDEV